MLERSYTDLALRQAMALLAIDSPTGFTEKAAQWVQDAFAALGYDARRTVKGGVLIDLGGKNADDALLLEAHTDTLGGMIAEIKGNGRLRLTNLGGMRAENGETENVRVCARDGRVYEGTLQLINASVHVNGAYGDTKRSWDSTEVLLDEDVKSAIDSGQTSGELFITMYPSIFQSHADLAHLMIGTNDCRRTVDAPHALHTGLEEFEKNVRFLLASLQSGGTRSVVSSIPPVDQQKIDAVFPEYRLESFEPDRQAFNGVLRRAAEDFGAVFNDMEPVYAAFSPAELTIEDGVHLNGHAHGLLAARVWALFQSIRTEQTAG